MEGKGGSCTLGHINSSFNYAFSTFWNYNQIWANYRPPPYRFAYNGHHFELLQLKRPLNSNHLSTISHCLWVPRLIFLHTHVFAFFGWSNQDKLLNGSDNLALKWLPFFRVSWPRSIMLKNWRDDSSRRASRRCRCTPEPSRPRSRGTIKWGFCCF